MARNINNKIIESVEEGKSYLLGKISNGLCLEFYQLRHGPSQAWTTACVGSTLSEFGAVPSELIDSILALQGLNGGWSYNSSVPQDADSTIRVLQFLHKIRFSDENVIRAAENFIYLHQQDDGGFSTYTREAINSLGYHPGKGWLMSHPCVTALALNQIRDENIAKRARQYMKNHLKRFGPLSYWWATSYYILYEMGSWQKVPLDQRDPVDLSLALLLEWKLRKPDLPLVKRILKLQQGDGSFVPSHQFRIPRPNQTLDCLTGSEEVVEDKKGIFSTCAAIIALARQGTFLN